MHAPIFSIYMKATSRLAKVQFDTTYGAGVYRLVNSLYDKIRHFDASQNKHKTGINLVDDVTRHQRVPIGVIGIIPEILTTHVRKKIRADKY